jgi:hypothetical protein
MVRVPPTETHLTDSDGRSLQLSHAGIDLFRYVYRPDDPQVESPRPYFHPVRTLRGDEVTSYRPADHVWHKGMAWSLPHVGPENFWGGPTFQRGYGYRQLPNNGRIRHEEFTTAEVTDGVLRVDEQLTWVTQEGETWLQERRQVGARVLPGTEAWLLAFRTTLRNVRGAIITFGSPTTAGRDNAGYGGLFWRGPASFSAGRVITSTGTGGDEYMGWRGRWLAFAGRHDADRASTLVFRDAPSNVGHPTMWFVRSEPFACVCPAPFFAAEFMLADGQSLHLRYDVAVANGELPAARCAELVAEMEASDLLGVPGAVA